MTSRKLFVSNIFFFFLLFFSFSFAQTNIGDVSASFCDGEKHTIKNSSFLVKADVPNDLCLSFTNTSAAPVKVDFSFVEGAITNDAMQSKACLTSAGNFGEFVSFSGYSFLLDAGQTLEKTGVIKFPLGYSGRVHWCLVYMLDQKPVKEKGGMFSVIMRRANFIDGIVLPKEVHRWISLSRIVYHYSGNVLALQFPVINSGDIDEHLVLSWLIRNAFGYERNFVLEKNIEYGSSVVLEQLFTDVPFYQGMYVVSGSLIALPVINVQISNIPGELKIPFSSLVQQTIVLIPWIMLLWIAGVISFLILLRILVNRLRKS